MQQITQLHLLKLFSYQSNQLLYKKYINRHILSKDTLVILDAFSSYFKAFPSKDEIDYENFVSWFQLTYSQFSNEEHVTFTHCFSRLAELPIQDTEQVLLVFLGLDAKEKIEQSWTDSFDAGKITTILEKYNQLLSNISLAKDDDAYTISKIDLKVIDKNNGISWCINELHQALGGLTLGNFILIAAYAGVGKSAFCISQAIHTLRQNLGKPVLYFYSEGSHNELWARFLCNLLRKEESFVIANQDKIMMKYLDKYGDNSLMVYYLKGRSTGYIRTKIEKYKPSLTIIDLLDAIKYNREISVQAQEDLYQEIRDMASKYCPIIATSQTDKNAVWTDSDSGKEMYRKDLGLSQLHNSKVGKQGAAESVLMIGMDKNYPNERYINVAKEKRAIGPNRS